MSQIKIYGLKENINKNRGCLSNAIHQALVEELQYPIEKKFQRFIVLEPENFIFPSGRSKLYTIIEVSMFEGRSKETKKAFIQALFRYISLHCDISVQDIEITLLETPRENWGIRGKNGDELQLNYDVKI